MSEPKRVLIVDDSKVITKLHLRLAKDFIQEIEADIFFIPEDALLSAKEKLPKYDFALIDYNMEGMSGIELVQQINDIAPECLPLDRVAIISANIQEAVKQKAYTLGLHFIEKPVDSEKLKEFLEEKGII